MAGYLDDEQINYVVNDGCAKLLFKESILNELRGSPSLSIQKSWLSILAKYQISN